MTSDRPVSKALSGLGILRAATPSRTIPRHVPSADRLGIEIQLKERPISRHRQGGKPFGFGFHRIHAQHFHPLTAVKMLQQGFLAVGKAHGVSVSKGFGTLLNEGNRFDFTNSQQLLQRLRDVS
jgi:hypothetical protein